MRLDPRHVRQAQRFGRLPAITYDTPESPSETPTEPPDGLDDPEGTDDATDE